MIKCYHCNSEFSIGVDIYVIAKTQFNNYTESKEGFSRWISFPGIEMKEQKANAHKNTIYFHAQCFKEIAGEALLR